MVSARSERWGKGSVVDIKEGKVKSFQAVHFQALALLFLIGTLGALVVAITYNQSINSRILFFCLALGSYTLCLLSIFFANQKRKVSKSKDVVNFQVVHFQVLAIIFLISTLGVLWVAITYNQSANSRIFFFCLALGCIVLCLLSLFFANQRKRAR